MTYKTILSLTLSLMIFACASDPCEETICGPGTCLEGICECPDGYFGNSCEENYFGIYAASLMKSAQCGSDFDIPSTAMAPPNPGERICYPFHGGQNCFYYRIELLENFSFKTTLNQIAIAPGGTETLVNGAFPSGTYSILDNTLNITFDNGVTQQLLIENSTLSWNISQTSEGFSNCELQLEFTKLEQ